MQQLQRPPQYKTQILGFFVQIMHDGLVVEEEEDWLLRKILCRTNLLPQSRAADADIMTYIDRTQVDDSGKKFLYTPRDDVQILGDIEKMLLVLDHYKDKDGVAISWRTD